MFLGKFRENALLSLSAAFHTGENANGGRLTRFTRFWSRSKLQKYTHHFFILSLFSPGPRANARNLVAKAWWEQGLLSGRKGEEVQAFIAVRG